MPIDGRVLLPNPDPGWEAFASREPYFAVLTAPKFLRQNLTPEHEREFFASGEELIDWIFHVIERLSPNFSPMSTLEYGCGPGRLAVPLARRPGALVAVDRSPAMLDAARREAARQGITHIEFRTPAELFTTPRKFDFVSCIHVLQRLPEDQGLELLRALMERLASGSIGVFQVPYRTAAAPTVRASRWIREYVPLANGIGNVLRGKPFGDPYIAAHTYDLDRVLGLFDDALASDVHVVFEHQQELSCAIVFVRMPLPFDADVAPQGRLLPGTTLRAWSDRDEREPPIDVKAVIAGTSIEELNRSAEEYFASLTDWEDHLAKPFSTVADAPRLLVDAATLLHGMQLKPGMTVLEFGAGTGWLSRWVTQLGCRAILVDVSATGLQIARELYTRLPVVGDRPHPEFVQSDGRRIDVPDASVDRIITFDAFHHVPNPDEMLRELARILRSGGIAGFTEPGSRHSGSPMSQFEMRTYRVVENDIDVHAIWRTARQCGFAGMKLAVFHGPPFYVSLEEYEDFLADGQTVERWRTSSRVFLRNARTFFLFKEGDEPVDSRTAAGLSCEILARLAEPPLENQPWVLEATVSNTSGARWLAADASYGGVKLGAHLYEASGRLLDFDLASAPLTTPAREILPDETVECRLTLPAQPAGRYRLEVDCVASRVTWFAQVGSRPAVLDVEVRPLR